MPPSTTPRGRIEVTEALLAAAAELFADRGPRATSVREVAAAAGVNHGLVHHYLGSKEALLSATLARLATRIADRVDELADPDPALAHDLDLHWRILARALLDGEDPTRLQAGHPVIGWLVGEGRRHGLAPRAAARAAAQIVTLELGWRLFHGYIATATGLADGEPLHQDLLARAWGDLTGPRPRPARSRARRANSR